ncbi:hypothetical protein [Rhizobium sp.]|uniref:hypothetical protein n=1 Tax=Rhizobium sp. TaxID=391 RepID=UPI000DDEFD6A
MAFRAQVRDILIFLLNAAGAAIIDAPQLSSTDKRQLQAHFATVIDLVMGLDDLMSLGTLNLRLDQILQSRAFRSARGIEVLLPGFGGGLVATTNLPRGFVAPERQTVQDVLQFVRQTVEEELYVAVPPVTLPNEKVAPFQYAFEGDRLTVVKQPAGAPIEGEIDDARRALLEQGERLLETLRASNSNPHLRSTFEALHKKIADGSGIVHLGILNMTCEAATNGAETEISDVLIQVLRAHTTGVRYYLAQFPEWAKFSDNAAELEISREEVDAFAREMNILAAKLEQEPFVEEEVPRTLRFIADFMAAPLSTLRRKGLALLRTLENLAIAAFQNTAAFGLSVLSDAANRSKKPLAVVLSGIIIVTVLHLGELALLETNAPWLKPAAEAIRRYEATIDRSESR